MGNRNAMAATLSLAQVTLSYNSNTTTASVPLLPFPLPGDISAMFMALGGQECEFTSTLVSSVEVQSCCDWEKFLPNLFGDCVRA